MGELASQAGRKVAAVAILVAAAYLLLKVVVGFVVGIVWVAVAVLAVVGVIWAVRTL